jgi:hypothetical protein
MWSLKGVKITTWDDLNLIQDFREESCPKKLTYFDKQYTVAHEDLVSFLCKVRFPKDFPRLFGPFDEFSRKPLILEEAPDIS